MKSFFNPVKYKFLKGAAVLFAFVALAFFVGAASVEAATLKLPPTNSGFIAYWPLNEGTTTVAADFSGNGNTGTLTSFASPGTSASGWTGSGRIGKALIFDGNSDYITVTDSDDFAFGSGDFTMATWVYFNALNQSATGPAFISQNEGGGTTPKWIFGYPGATSGAPAGDQNKTAFHINNTGQVNGYWVSSTAWTPVVGQWYHLVVTRSGSTFSFYRNGVADGTDTEAYAVPNVNSDLRIGQSEGTFFMNGRMDDIRIYNRALTSAEVAQLYRTTSGSKVNASRNNEVTNGLVGLWSFDGTDILNGVLYDRSPRGGKNANFQNISSSTFYSIGRIGQAATFNGSTQYARIADSDDLSAWSANGEMTVSAWVKVLAWPSTGQNRSPIMAKSTTNNFEYALYVNGTSALGGNSRTAAFETYVPNGTLSHTYISGPADRLELNKWHHVVGVYRSATAPYSILYIDGVQSGTTGTKSSSMSNGTSPLDIAHRPDDGTGQYLNAVIDDVRIYNRVITAGEVNRLYAIGTSSKANATVQGTAASSLIGHWTFDGTDILSGVMRDRARGNNGSFQNIASSTFYKIGKIGQAGNFDGVDDYVNIGTNVYVNADTARGTFATWFKMDTYPANDDFFSLFDIEGYLGGQIYGVGGAAKIRVRMVTGSTGATTLTTGRWYHYAQTWDGTTMKGYLDGVEDVTFSIGSPTPASLSRISTIGSAYNATQLFDGSIDDARLYNRDLSATEILKLYNAGK